MNLKQLIQAAKSVLVAKGWAQHWFVYDDKGQKCSIISDEAASFCGRGALDRIFYTPTDRGIYSWDLHEAASALLSEIAKEFGSTPAHLDPYTFWQDKNGRTKEEVLELFDRAIDRAHEFEKTFVPQHKKRQESLAIPASQSG